MGWVGQEDSLVHESSRCASIHLSLAHICNPGTAFVRWWVETKLPGSFQVGSQELAAGQKQEDPFLNKAEDKTNSSDPTLDITLHGDHSHWWQPLQSAFGTCWWELTDLQSRTMTSLMH